MGPQNEEIQYYTTLRLGGIEYCWGEVHEIPAHAFTNSLRLRDCGGMSSWEAMDDATMIHCIKLQEIMVYHL